MYMEDDTQVLWPSLKAWARDEELLAPFGLHRGFVRVETGQWSGMLVANDQLGSVQLPSNTFNVSTGTPDKTSHHFVHLNNSYMAMWLATRDQLQQWLKSAQWALNEADVSGGMIREAAAWNLYSVMPSRSVANYSTRIPTTLMVPYNPVTSRVMPIAMIRHLDTKESACSSETAPPAGFCSVSIENLLVP